MDKAFLKILNMSISASWLVLVVLLLRLLLKKSPRWVHVALWALVAIRLMCPLSPESALSLMPEKTTERMVESISDGYYGDAMIYSQGSENYEAAVSAGVEPSVGDNGYHYVLTQPDDPTKPVQTLAVLYGKIWVAGAAVMLGYALVSYLRLREKVSASMEQNDGVYICDYIDTPFILGIVKPKIYLPSSLEPEAISYVLAHERSHIVRKDHWWKPLGYALLTLHWFNPLLWLAYILLCRDIELACDEKVIRDMEGHQKKAYSEALLNCSISRRYVAACPLAFGEVGVKERVKTVLNYKKPAFWVILMAVAALIVTAVCFLTDPVERVDRETAQWFEEYAYEQVSGRMKREDVVCLDAREGYALIHCRGDGPELILYRYEKKGNQIEILDSCTGEYAISGGMSLNHVESEEKHIYFGTASQYHWNPQAEVNTTLYWNYMTMTDSDGEIHEKDMTGKEGFLFVLDTPMRDFQVLDVLETECLNLKKYTEQGYYMVEAVFESGKDPTASTPYDWTSTLENWQIKKCWAYQSPGSFHSIIDGSELEKLVYLLNNISQDEVVSRGYIGPDDPIWNLQRATVHIARTDGEMIFLGYVDNAVIIRPESDSGLWETKGYWSIENNALKEWMRSISLGGTQMLSDENREEIRMLLGQENVTFIQPREYGDLLFVGCWFDGGRGMAVACYEPLADGFRLLKLIRDSEIKTCASGSELYYCDYEDLRIFLILNQSITGMEWAGGYQKTYTIDTHPGLVVEYFPENLNAMYRFNYGGGASTMYMDWNDRTHGEPPRYATDVLADPDDAYSVLSNLCLSDVCDLLVSKTEDVDEKYSRAIAKSLSSRQIVDLMNILREIPEGTYEPAEYNGGTPYGLEIILHPDGTPEGSYLWITLTLSDGAIYYKFTPDRTRSYQTWKIMDEALVEFVRNQLSNDSGQWHRFAPYPKADGEISFTNGDQQITVHKLLCFEYDYTEEGICFKPQEETGWLELQLQEDPYSPPEVPSLRIIHGTYAGMEAVYGYYVGSDSWRHLDLTYIWEGTAYHLLLRNDDGDPWVEEYGREIAWILENLMIAPEG